MILKEALIGGTVYLDYDEREMALPENERIAFDYRALTNREKINLLHKNINGIGRPNGAEICELSVIKVRNLFYTDGKTPMDTIAKLLDYKDGGNTIAYMLTIVGAMIWNRQSGDEVGLKN